MSFTARDGRANGQPKTVGRKGYGAVTVRPQQAGFCLMITRQNGGMGKVIAVLPPCRNDADLGFDGVDETGGAGRVAAVMGDEENGAFQVVTFSGHKLFFGLGRDVAAEKK